MEQGLSAERKGCDSAQTLACSALPLGCTDESMTTPAPFPSQDASSVQQQIEQDLALVQRILAGDQRAFREMYRHYSPYFYRRFLRWTNDEDAARDSLQQFSCRAFNTSVATKGMAYFMRGSTASQRT